MYFKLNNSCSVEFTYDGSDFEIQMYDSAVSVFMQFKPVHVRAMIQYMTKILPEIEKSERVGTDCDLVNNNPGLIADFTPGSA